MNDEKFVCACCGYHFYLHEMIGSYCKNCAKSMEDDDSGTWSPPCGRG